MKYMENMQKIPRKKDGQTWATSWVDALNKHVRWKYLKLTYAVDFVRVCMCGYVKLSAFHIKFMFINLLICIVIP